MSSVEPLKVVFTAQSKREFYCRDAVCEYALAQGCVPLNPFRCFEYFLGDRVDRDLIRQANNNLVRVADELWVFGPIADGVLFEIEYALTLGKPIRFFTIASQANEITPIVQPDDLRFEMVGVFGSYRNKEQLLQQVFEPLFADQPLPDEQLRLMEDD